MSLGDCEDSTTLRWQMAKAKGTPGVEKPPGSKERVAKEKADSSKKAKVKTEVDDKVHLRNLVKAHVESFNYCVDEGPASKRFFHFHDIRVAQASPWP